MKTLYRWLALVAAGTILTGCGPTSGEGQASQGGMQHEPVFPVTVAEVERGSITESAPLLGTTRYLRRTVLKSEANGMTLELTVREGDSFTKGQLLAKQDDRDYRVQLAQAQANLQRAARQLEELKAGTRAEVIAQIEATIAEAQAQVRLSDDELKRTKSLFDQKVRTEAELIRAEANKAMAEARLQQAQTRLTEAKNGPREVEIRVAEAEVAVQQARVEAVEHDIRKCTIVAPFDGVVLERFIELGYYLESGENVLEIASREQLEARMEVPDRYIAFLKTGTTFTVTADALPDETFDARIVGFIPLADEQSHNVELRAMVENPGTHLVAGMFVRGNLPVVSRTDTMLIPQNAITLKDEQQVVFRVKDDNSVEQLPVRVGLATAEKAEILDPPLEPGMRLVTTGGELLFPGAKVKPAGAGSPPNQDASAPHPN